MNRELIRDEREFGEFTGEPLCVTHKFGSRCRDLEGETDTANGCSRNGEWIGHGWLAGEKRRIVPEGPRRCEAEANKQWRAAQPSQDSRCAVAAPGFKLRVGAFGTIKFVFWWARFLPARPIMRGRTLVCLAVSLSVVAAGGTSPSEPSYVSNPSGRGTVGLIWSCILTLWPCVWTAIHVNMPGPGWTSRKRFLKKLKYAGCALVLPEVMLALMLIQFLSTWALAKDMNATILAKRDLEPGLADHDDDHHGCPPSTIITSEKELNHWNLTISFFALMGGFKLKCDGATFNKDRAGRPQYTISPQALINMARKGILPPLNHRLCKERGKSDAIGKLFVVGQVAWFMLQCIARKASGLPVTLLEINTVVHVACAIGIYALMWHKPQDATEPIEFDVTRCATCQDFFLQHKNQLITRTTNTDELYTFKNSPVGGGFAIVVLSAIYGGLHAVAWDAHFPSYQEQIIWRVSVVCTVVTSILLPWGLGEFNETDTAKFLTAIAIAPRLYLVLEAFISVRSLPVGAYQTVDWVGFLPHIG